MEWYCLNLKDCLLLQENNFLGELYYGNKEISILDSACGNGVAVTALALNGY